MRLLLSLCAALALLVPARAAETIPPPPAQYCNDFAGVLSAGTRQGIENRLEAFEKATSSQIVVAVFPKLESDSSVEDYTVRVAQSWHAGQKGKDNGAVLFVFVAEHKVRIEVGYGLEGALPDALCKQIVEDAIVPRFRQGDFDGGVTAGVSVMIAAAKGEYQGTGTTVAERGARHQGGNSLFGVIFFLIVILVLISRSKGGGSGGSRSYSSSGWTGAAWGAALGSSLRGGGGFGGGSFGGGGGGGFSGGGGSFGGGGAGGSW